MTEHVQTQLPATPSTAPAKPNLPANPAGPNIAAAWYVAMSSTRLRRRPQELDLFGRPLVAWRDGKGRPAVMSRWCPHQGASLGLGRVVGGDLRCPFHHWRFDGTGSCVAVPGLDRIPATAKVRRYPTVERYGFVWVWYGTPEPLYDVPDFPPLAGDRGRYVGFRYADRTTGTIRHLLENAVDHYHFRALHGLTMQDVEFKVLGEPDEAADNGAPIGPRSAWFGVRIRARLPRPPLLRHPYVWLTSVVSTFGVGEGFDLLVDGWPGGQRFTFSVDGEEIYSVLMGVTPTGDRDTTQIGWAGVRRTGKPVRTAARLALFYVQNRAGTQQDVPIYDTTVTDDSAVYVRYDSGVVRFRRWYQEWAERARTTEDDRPVSADAALARTPGRTSSGQELAAAWYVALPSGRLGRRPVRLELFGTQVVAWRDGTGAPVVMERRCPHQGADLSLGGVVGGSLRCPFHHWRFDASGACIEASGAARIPAGARVRSYPVAERYGFVWAWYGGAEPLYEVPDFPPLDGSLGPIRRYAFSYRTPVPPRRVLENAFDPAHFHFVHGLPRRTSPILTWLTDPADTGVNGVPIGAGAFVGARLDVPMRLPGLPERVAAGRPLSLVVDGWPGGQRLTFQLGDRAIAKELLAITPVRPGLTVFQGWTVMPKSGVLGSAPALWAYRYQHRLGTLQDLKIYRDAALTDGSVNQPQDEGVLRFRKYYAGWVERARELGK